MCPTVGLLIALNVKDHQPKQQHHEQQTKEQQQPYPTGRALVSSTVGLLSTSLAKLNKNASSDIKDL